MSSKYDCRCGAEQSVWNKDDLCSKCQEQVWSKTWKAQDQIKGKEMGGWKPNFCKTSNGSIEQRGWVRDNIKSSN